MNHSGLQESPESRLLGAGFVRALPAELVDRIFQGPDPSPPWLDSLAELIAEKLKPVIRSEVRAALKGKS